MMRHLLHFTTYVARNCATEVRDMLNVLTFEICMTPWQSIHIKEDAFSHGIDKLKGRYYLDSLL